MVGVIIFKVNVYTNIPNSNRQYYLLSIINYFIISIVVNNNVLLIKYNVKQYLCGVCMKQVVFVS